MAKKKRKRCPHCNKLYSPSYLQTHIRREHGKKGAHRGKVKGRPNHYAQRNSKGQFTKWTEIMPAGIRRDAATKSKHRPKKPGQGHRGDYGRK